MSDSSSTLPPAPEAFVVLLPVRLIDPFKQPALTAMAGFMALTRSIADDPKMPGHLKDANLTALDGAMTTEEGYVPLPKGVRPTVMSPGFTLRRESDNRKIPVAYGRRVVQAYKQDAIKKRYRDWSEFLVYLRYSAGASAGYAVGALGLDKALTPQVEALACAHALLARMASVQADYANGQKVYLPQRWFSDAGLDGEELSFDGNGAAWLKVRDQGVVQARQMLLQSASLLKGIKDRKLRMAFAWARTGVEARCAAFAAVPVYPVVSVAEPSRLKRLLKTLRAGI
jgi:phytoene/squalene synthetase